MTNTLIIYHRDVRPQKRCKKRVSVNEESRLMECHAIVLQGGMAPLQEVLRPKLSINPAECGLPTDFNMQPLSGFVVDCVEETQLSPTWHLCTEDLAAALTPASVLAAPVAT